jgi:vacuolar protein sorting-associated protein 29
MAQLVLVIGDLFVPQRVSEIPKEIIKALPTNKFQHIICTGNIGSYETYDWLKSLSKNIHIVKGESDEDLKLNEQKTVKIGGFNIGIINGYQIVPYGDLDSLIDKKNQLSCDVLITGHSNKIEIINYEGNYILNPGSGSGAYSIMNSDNNPSFMVLLIQSDLMTVYTYELNNTKNFEIAKYEINKIIRD